RFRLRFGRRRKRNTITSYQQQQQEQDEMEVSLEEMTSKNPANTSNKQKDDPTILSRNDKSKLERRKKIYDNYSDTAKSLLLELANLVHALTFQNGSDDEITICIHQWIVTRNTTSKYLFKLLRNSIHIPQYACLLAFFYHYSIGTRFNSRKTLKYYQLAANMGDSFAANQTGICYAWSIGVEKCDLQMEIRYYRISAELGHPQGQSNLAHAIRRGIVHEFCDKREALFWYLKATDTGYPAASWYVADCYKNGCGTMVDYHKMLIWYTKYLKKQNVAISLNFLINNKLFDV
ncbi:1587_t:CDS:2, partial [Ambispora leptoticha]